MEFRYNDLSITRPDASPWDNAPHPMMLALILVAELLFGVLVFVIPLLLQRP